MSTPTPIEDRLTAALHARADLVTHEDLTTLLVPAAHRARRPRRGSLIAAAVAAAVVTAVMVVPLTGGGDGGSEPPQPAPAPEPTPSVEQGREEVVTDLDGDGEDDRAWIADDQLQVEVSSGTRAGVPVVPGTRILPPVVDAGTPHPMVVAVPPAGTGERATTVTYREGDLVVDVAPESLAIAPGTTVWVDDIGALMLGEYDAEVPADQRVLVAATAYRGVRNGNLVEHGAGDLCWDRVGDAYPLSCDQLPQQDADPSQMFPVIQERYPVGVPHGDFDGRYDHVVLRPAGGRFELSYTWDAVKTIAPVPTEAAPELLGGAISSSLDAPAFVVAYPDGDVTAMSVFAPTSDLGFRALETQDGRFLGDSTTGRLEQRTWVSQASGLWTVQQVSPDQPNLYSVTRWSIEDNSLVADDQGDACLDLDRGLKLDDAACGAADASG